MQKYAKSSTTGTSYAADSLPIVSSSSSVRHTHDGLLGLE